MFLPDSFCCSTPSRFACFNAITGEEVYGKLRIGSGARAFTSSPWAYDGKLFLLSEDGDTFVIQAGNALDGRSIDDRKIQLLLSRAQAIKRRGSDPTENCASGTAV